MEKSRSDTSDFCTRLLIVCGLFFLLFSQQPFAQRINKRVIRALRITPISTSGFTDTQNGFAISIPGAMPEDIQLGPQSLPEGVSLVSSRQSVYSTGTESVMGTQVTLLYVFSEPGEYVLSPIIFYIRGEKYQFPFDPIKITEDPATVMPRLFIHFTHGVYSDDAEYEVVKEISDRTPIKGAHAVVGTPVKFVIYIQYAVQILKCDWKLQKGALCTQTNEYEITKGHNRGSIFSEQKIPVAEFEWEPLTEGDWNLPPMVITASAYNGSRVELTLPRSAIPVVQNANQDTAQTQVTTTNLQNIPEMFSSAFVEEEHPVPAIVVSDNGLDCANLAALRIEERHSLPFSSVVYRRKQLEKDAGIVSSENETSVLLRTIVICVFIICGIACVLSVVAKKLHFIVITFVLLLCLCTGIAYLQIQLHHTYGIFAGGSLYSIPEETASEASDFTAITVGSRVEILEHPGAWMYIQFNGTGGWVKSNQIYVIK